MATNKLMEAAADILTKSKASAPAMPPQKLEGEVQDLGGPTNTNSKPLDDSNKLKSPDTDHSAKNKASIATKPSAASAKMEDAEVEVNDEDIIEEDENLEEMKHSKKEAKHDDDEDKEEVEEGYKKSMKEDIDAMFADDETISEDFKSKAATIFEARVHDRITQIEEEIEAKYAGQLEEAVETIRQDLTEKVDNYLSYVVEQWMEDNELAVESGLRSELTEEFIAGMRNLFAEHYIDVPAEKVDLVDELATKVEELESKLDEEIERGVEYKQALVESRKNEITRVVTEGLTDTQVEKIKSLAESVEFSTEDEYKAKLETIRENYFPSDVKKADAEQLHENVDDAEDKKEINDPFVAAVSQAISKTKK
jgi:hypothetical protein